MSTKSSNGAGVPDWSTNKDSGWEYVPVGPAISAQAVRDQAMLNAKLAQKAGEARFFVTYGYGSNLEGCFSEFRAKDYDAARTAAFAGTGGKHAFLYSEREWTADGISQQEKYNLREVPLQPQRRITPYTRGFTR